MMVPQQKMLKRSLRASLKVHEGEIFSGVVTRIIPIGAFVEILQERRYGSHIQLSEARVERVEDVVRQGDEVTVRVREIDSRGRINLTLRVLHKMEGCLTQNQLYSSSSLKLGDLDKNSSFSIISLI